MSNLCSDFLFHPCITCGAVQWTRLESWITNLASCLGGAHQAVVPLSSHAHVLVQEAVAGCKGDLLYNYIKDIQCMSKTKCILKHPVNVAKPFRVSQINYLNFCNASIFYSLISWDILSGKSIAKETIMLYFKSQQCEARFHWISAVLCESKRSSAILVLLTFSTKSQSLC